MIDQLGINVICILAGLYIGEHIKTPLQFRVFVMFGALLIFAQSCRWLKAREQFREAMRKWNEDQSRRGG